MFFRPFKKIISLDCRISRNLIEYIVTHIIKGEEYHGFIKVHNSRNLFT